MDFNLTWWQEYSEICLEDLSKARKDVTLGGITTAK
jgi:hypothetical protein